MNIDTNKAIEWLLRTKYNEYANALDQLNMQIKGPIVGVEDLNRRDRFEVLTFEQWLEENRLT